MTRLLFDPHVHGVDIEKQVLAAFAKNLSLNAVNYFDSINYEKLRKNHYALTKQGLEVTDYDSVLEISKGDKMIYVTRGQEVSIEQGKHIIAIGVSAPVRNELSLEETIDEIASAGGGWYAPHHTCQLFSGIGKKLFEEFNIGLGANYMNRRLVGEINAWVCGGFKGFNDSAAKQNKNVHEMLARKYDSKVQSFDVIGGSDAKFPDQVGAAYTVFEGNFDTNTLPQKIRDAILAGTYMSVEGYCNPLNVCAQVAGFKWEEGLRCLRGEARRGPFNKLVINKKVVSEMHI